MELVGANDNDVSFGVDLLDFAYDVGVQEDKVVLVSGIGEALCTGRKITGLICRIQRREGLRCSTYFVFGPIWFRLDDCPVQVQQGKGD